MGKERKAFTWLHLAVILVRACNLIVSAVSCHVLFSFE